MTQYTIAARPTGGRASRRHEEKLLSDPEPTIEARHAHARGGFPRTPDTEQARRDRLAQQKHDADVHWWAPRAALVLALALAASDAGGHA